MIGISAAIAFALTWIVWKEDLPQEAPAKAAPAPAAAPTAAPAPAAAPAAEAVKAASEEACDLASLDTPVVFAINKAIATVKAPVHGKIVAQEDIPDPLFSAGALGGGVGIEPTEGVVYAPCDGEISTVAETGHAIGISAAEDMEILIHVGIDTVKMAGKGFKPFVKEGDQVKEGQKLLEFDREAIKEFGVPDMVVFLLTNSDDYDNVKIGQ
jgi:PTS system sucrose-specific IIC component